jgi:hypothetical protein
MKRIRQFTLVALLASRFALPAFAQTPASISTPDRVETQIGEHRVAGFVDFGTYVLELVHLGRNQSSKESIN